MQRRYHVHSDRQRRVQPSWWRQQSRCHYAEHGIFAGRDSSAGSNDGSNTAAQQCSGTDTGSAARFHTSADVLESGRTRRRPWDGLGQHRFEGISLQRRPLVWEDQEGSVHERGGCQGAGRSAGSQQTVLIVNKGSCK